MFDTVILLNNIANYANHANLCRERMEHSSNPEFWRHMAETWEHMADVTIKLFNQALQLEQGK